MRRKASGEWIFWLDADEELLPESVAELRRIVAGKEALACYICRQDLVDAARPDYFTEMWQLRIFRNRLTCALSVGATLILIHLLNPLQKGKTWQ